MSGSETVAAYAKSIVRTIGIIIGATLMIVPISVICALEKLQSYNTNND